MAMSAKMAEIDSYKQKIKTYWNDKQPSLWYSKKHYGTKEYYEEVEHKRYSIFYPYTPNIAEFKNYRDKKVLEIGVGMGIDLKQYAKNGAICYGIDLTEGAIGAARKHLQVYGLTADLRVMDAENLEFDDNTFDLVYSFGVLHHTPNTQKAIDGVYRILKPGGKAIIMLYSKSWQHYIIRYLYYGKIRGMIKELGSVQALINFFSEAYGNSPLTKLYKKKEVKGMFSSFSDVKISHYHYKVPYRNGLRQKIASLKNRNYLMGNWIIKALKPSVMPKS